MKHTVTRISYRGPLRQAVVREISFLDGRLSSPALDADAISHRTTACASCPDADRGADQCRRCGCSMPLSRRLQSPWQSCPKGLWPAAAIPADVQPKSSMPIRHPSTDSA